MKIILNRFRLHIYNQSNLWTNYIVEHGNSYLNKFKYFGIENSKNRLY